MGRANTLTIYGHKGISKRAENGRNTPVFLLLEEQKGREKGPKASETSKREKKKVER